MSTEHTEELEREHRLACGQRLDQRVQRPPSLQRATAIGNRGFARLLARMQDGGDPPQRARAPRRTSRDRGSHGRGNPLATGVARHPSPRSAKDVRVHTDDHAAALARAVEARAFTVGNDIFFGPGEYAPATRGGAELIAHEVTHVVQQRGASATGPLSVSQPGDASEREAEAVARDVTR
jgi:hypothetical protein